MCGVRIVCICFVSSEIWNCDVYETARLIYVVYVLSQIFHKKSSA